ncbi:hypothetical protein G6F59_012721 [Rhizopus arrhizus]|nr:hypothetical protein G6F59_012721 [Rhizopus arrhizus]
MPAGAPAVHDAATDAGGRGTWTGSGAARSSHQYRAPCAGDPGAGRGQWTVWHARTGGGAGWPVDASVSARRRHGADRARAAGGRQYAVAAGVIGTGRCGMIRILLAEDQAMVRGALSALLGLEPDIEVLGSAADGEAAWRMLQQLKPDILVTDIEMPGLSGLELAQRIARHELPIKVVIVTTFARAGFLRRALDAGVLGYLLKDAPAENLADALRKVNQGIRAIDPQLALDAWSQADPLTDRERRVLRLAGEGRTASEIAEQLGLSHGVSAGAAEGVVVGDHFRDRGGVSLSLLVHRAAGAARNGAAGPSRAGATHRCPALPGETGDGAELAALKHRRLFAPDSPAMLGSLKADWKVKINGNGIHAWRGSTGCSCAL